MIWSPHDGSRAPPASRSRPALIWSHVLRYREQCSVKRLKPPWNITSQLIGDRINQLWARNTEADFRQEAVCSVAPLHADEKTHLCDNQLEVHLTEAAFVFIETFIKWFIHQTWEEKVVLMTIYNSSETEGYFLFYFYKFKDNFKRFESVKEIFSLTLTARQEKASF